MQRDQKLNRRTFLRLVKHKRASEELVEEPRFSKIQIVFLCTAFFLTGILFRLHGITESLWLDEALMAWRTETLSAVFLTMDGSPPVFPFFVWISRQLFGGEPWALRVPSVL